MCGITGVFNFYDKITTEIENVKNAVSRLENRGPNNKGVYTHNNISLGHTRLSVIDTSDNANQPLTDETKNYTIVFNGEFYNYLEEQEILKTKGYKFVSKSDTEVLLNMYIEYGPEFINKVNGCFAIAIYDKQKEQLFLSRDRIGIKPLVIYHDAEKFIFGSEMKAVAEYNIPKILDNVSLYNYLQFNYVPAPQSIYKNISKLTPGSYLLITPDKLEKVRYYTIPQHKINDTLNYTEAKNQLKEQIDSAVKHRLVSDVPLGAFLSGGIDSSVIVATASKYVENLNTFSIGYKDEPYFDETIYAELVAKKFKTNHTTFKLTNKELYDNLFEFLDYIDEPFADSSALVVYILSKLTKEKVTVALSGDGADEIFSGYNKHLAHYQALQNSIKNSAIKSGKLLWDALPKSRNSKITNTFRKLNKFEKGLNANNHDRYWMWATLMSEKDARKLLKVDIFEKDYENRKKEIFEYLETDDIADILYADSHLVLQNDMLTKVDLMSMANGLEVRTPFLDHNLVDFAFSLPSEFKINSQIKKRILQDAYRDILPEELYKRPKHGFEVPLLKWLRTELDDLLRNDLLSKTLIEKQGIFNFTEVEKLLNKLHSSNPEDTPANIWALLVFQYWWKQNNSLM